MSVELDDEESSFYDPYRTAPFRRLIGHHLLDSSSFKGMTTSYLIILPLIIVFVLTGIKVGNFFLLFSKIEFNPAIESEVASVKESFLVGILSSTAPQILIWATILYGLLRYLGGKGSYLKSLSIYCISQIPVVIGALVLLAIAATQPEVVIQTDVADFNIFEAFNTATWGYKIADTILIPTTFLYSHIMIAIGLSIEHETPKSIGFFVSGMAYIAVMLFYFLI
ncbi:MAG: YIP1 family protein [Candidatus Thorarchaeota archaeon]